MTSLRVFPWTTGGPDSLAIGVPEAQEGRHSTKNLLRLRRPDRQAIGATRITRCQISRPPHQFGLGTEGKEANRSRALGRGQDNPTVLTSLASPPGKPSRLINPAPKSAKVPGSGTVATAKSMYPGFTLVDSE